MTRIDANNARIAPCATTAPCATSPDERFLWNRRSASQCVASRAAVPKKDPGSWRDGLFSVWFFQLLVERGVLSPHGAIRALFAFVYSRHSRLKSVRLVLGEPAATEKQSVQPCYFRCFAKNAHVRFHESICSGESLRSRVSGLTRRLNVWPQPAAPGGGSL
jgi:hypothetical protein